MNITLCRRGRPLRPFPRTGSGPGFALITTISILVLLALVAVGMLTLSAVTVRSSAQAGPSAEARKNARLALILAIGELQKYTGPDQRVTATADIAGDSTGLPLQVGAAPANSQSVNGIEKGLSQLQNGTRHWTGVWQNEDEAVEIFKSTPSPTFLRWLVSGGEDPSPAAEMTPANSTPSLGSGGSVSDREKAVILVGRNTAGSPGDNLEDYVAVPLVNIAEGGNTNRPTGRYGWWVGDEGVKSKLNSSVPYGDREVATYRELSTPRRGWESVDGFSKYPLPGAANAERISRVITVPEAGFLDPSLAKTPGTDSPLQTSFHAATTDSAGVLADSLQGGLRIDLTTLFEGDLPSSSTSTFFNGPSKNANLIPRTIAPRMRGPKWERLQEFHLKAQADTSNELTVKDGSPLNFPAISPTITDLRLLMGVRMVLEGTSAYKLYPCGKVAIALANPYPYPLKWGSELELEIINITPQGNAPSRIWDAAGQPAFLPRDRSEPAVFNNAYFRIPADELQPGEAKAYTNAGPTIRPANSTARVIVDLEEFGSSNPNDLQNSVQLEHNGVNNGSRLLDVRESWTTSLVVAELREAGGSGRNFLRRIEGIQLDNGFFANVRRQVDATMARRMTRPFALHLFSFQLSQPGNDYWRVLPSRNLMGTRSSTMRTFADFNVQGMQFHAAITSYNPPPYFMESSDALSDLPFRPPGGDTGRGFTRNLVLSPLPWGRSPFDAEKTVLFSPPRQFVSLAQLQHADLTGDDFGVSVGHQPGNAVGNSYHTPFVKRNETVKLRRDYVITGSPNRQEAKSTPRNYYDLAYLLNASLWDTYFYSAIPASGTPEPENRNLVRFATPDSNSDARDPEKIASQFLIDGAFNVNSTRPEAWKALLASSQNLSHPAEAGQSSGAFFPRSLEQPDSSETPPSGVDADSYSGYRRLSEEELDNLAVEITQQVRLRGPFLSLSHFVNRAIVDIAQNKELGRSGALQSALDESGININREGDLFAFTDINPENDRVILQANGQLPRADLDGGDRTVFPNERFEEYPVWPPSSRDDNPGSVASILADRPMLIEDDLRREQGYRSTGIPGWLTQADVLQVIGPSLSARSDTFRIRAYGESLDSDGKVLARAWCEAIVQRVPTYVDGSDAPTDRDTDLSSTNQKFGRRYQMVSFRWLSPDEI